MEIKIRKFEESDIPFKVSCINNEMNNKYLHYDLPLKEDKTLIWFQSLSNRKDRIDFTITCDDEPAGLIGLLNIDLINKKAEYYICLDGDKYRGKGVASRATDLLIRECAVNIQIKKIYLFTETENSSAQRLFERIGFKQEGLLRNDLIHFGRNIDRYVYGLIVDEYLEKEK